MSSSVAESSTAAAAAAAVVTVAAKDGDWTCSDNDCNHSNFARRTECNKCHRERSIDETPAGTGGSSSSKKKLGTEIGKAAAEKSRGLFSAEDWQCSKCANVNWARRQTCNMCNAPKFSDVEERTGYGGGYNDRGVVEYKERSESDSEYDEFGRLKKRKNKDDTCSKEKKCKKLHEIVDRAEPKKEQKEEDDDEDDEEDDGGDLSKYDLWGDDEIDAVASATAPPKSTKNDTQKSTNSGAKILSAKKGKSSLSRSTSSSSSTSSSTSSSSSESSSSSSSSTSSSRSSSPAVKTRSRSPQPRSLSKEKTSRSNSLKSASIKLQRHRSRERSKTHSQHSHTSSSRKQRRNHTSKSHSRSRSRSSTSSSSTSAKRKARCRNSAASRSPRTNKRVARRTRSRSLSRQRR